MEISRKSGSAPFSLFSRRGFLTGAGAMLLRAATMEHSVSRFASAQRLGGYPFTLGVASGDPSPDGVVLWTRLAPDPLNGGGMPPRPVAVHWEIALDDAMRRRVRYGTAAALPEWAHSVHIEVSGLEPDRWYWYRFRAGDAESQIARTRTMPAEDSSPDQLRMAFASCQNFQTGY